MKVDVLFRWGNMKYRNQLLVLAGVTVVLSSCSMLGNRKESTKLDLEGTSISQMRIIGAKGHEKSDSTPDSTAEKGAAANPSSVNYEASFVDPKERAKDYIEKNKINFDKIKDKTQFAQGMDRASLFFDLGARLRANPEILEVNEETTKHIPAYTAEKIEKIRGELNCGANLQSFVLRGTANIDLNNTELGLIMTDEEKEDYLDSQYDAATVGQIFFKHFSEEAQDYFFDSFDPRLNQVKVGIAHHIEFCSTGEGGPKAYMSDYKDYYPIDAGNISSTNDAITMKFSRVVTKDEISSLPLNSDQVPTLDRVTFGVDDENKNEIRIDVFGANSLHQKNIITSFKAEKASSTPTTGEKPAPATGGAASPEKPGTTTPAAPVKAKPTLPTFIPSLFISDDPRAGPIVTGENGHNGLTFNSGSSGITTGTTTTIASLPPAPAMTDEEFAKIIAAEPFYQKNLSKTLPITPGWFNPSIQGYATKFYKFDPAQKKYVYAPGKKNLEPWNDDAYSMKTKPMLTSSQVNELCSPYKFQKEMVFNVAINPTSKADETNKAPYLTLPNGEQKSYRHVLKDQLDLDSNLILEDITKEDAGAEVKAAEAESGATTGTEKMTAKDKVVMSIVDAVLKTPEEIKNQEWRIKVCYGIKPDYVPANPSQTPRDFVAFLKTSETSLKFKYERRSVSSTPREDAWISNSYQEELKPKSPGTLQGIVPDGFNPDRQKPHSTFSIACHPTTHACYGVGQFAFKSEMEIETTEAYLDQKTLRFPSMIYKAFKSTRDKGGMTRRELWMGVGFPINLNGPDVETVPALFPDDLMQNGVTSTTLSPAGRACFTGDNPEMELEIFPSGSTS
jgi:hypothetical protein